MFYFFFSPFNSNLIQENNYELLDHDVG